MLTRRILLLATLVLGISGTSFAQVATGTPQGTPPFGAISAGPTDSVDLANLNVHIDIPVLHKAGRGIPFSYDVTYDTSLWAPYGVEWLTSGPPNSSFGWFFPQQGGVREIAVGSSFCGSPLPSGAVVGYAFIYYDPLGTRHPLQGTLEQRSGSCGSGYSFSGGGPATDGSGYVLSADSSGNIKVTAKSGQVVYWSNSSNGYVQPVATDDNGNEITLATSNSVFTDTLGATALTLGGSGTPSSPRTFTYTAPSGGTAFYALKYTPYTVKTNFGCSGISDYGPTANNLPSELDLPDGTKYTFTYEATPGYSGDVTGRLASVTFPTGATVNYTYTGGNNGTGIECKDGSTAGLTRQTPDGTWTYSRTLGTGAASTTTITAPLYNGQNNQTVMNFQGIYPTETQAYQGSASSGTLLKTTLVCYNGSTPSGSPATCNSAAVTLPITRKTTYIQWPGTTVLESEANAYYNSYGMLTESDEYAYGNGSPGALSRKTLTSYANLGNGIVNKPAQITVQDGSGNVKAQTTYTYDQGTLTATSGTPQHVSISGSRGNLTTISSLISGSATLTKTFTYFDTGNINVATDVNGAQTTYTYGACGNSFPTVVSGPLNLSKSMAWSCTGSVTTSQTDANNATVSTGFTDSYFWRANSMIDPQSNVTSLAYASQTSVESSLSITGSSTADGLSTLDILGRAHVAQQKQSPSATTYDSSETDYDALGRPSRVTMPYSGTAGQTASPTWPSATTVYDALSRVSSATDAGGGTLSYTYSQNDKYASAGPAPSGENAKRRRFEYDALGRLTSVCEITSGTGSGNCAQTSSQTGYWTQYTYDVNNRLTSVTQNAQSSTTQTRSYTYDDLGRMTSETNPESGTTTYAYDTDSSCGTSTGDLVKKVDAVGNTICYAYDTLHRITSTTYPTGSYASVTPSRYFVYDSATVSGVTMSNTKARLGEAYTCTSCPGTKITDVGFSYTSRGEVSDVYESTPHSSGYYHVKQTYWPNGAINQLSGLSGLPTITYSVDGEGRVYSASASSGQNPLTTTTYSVASSVTQVNLGSSDSDSFTYDPNTNRMTQYKFTVNSQSLVGNLTWNALGTLGSLVITDPFNSADAQTCNYSHDDLSRIAGVNCGSIWSQTFTYDAFGNINKSGTISFQATYSTSTNRMTSIGSSTPTYDANGNVTNDFLNTYAWDANARPVTADNVGLTYDALGRMVEQNRSGAYTEIVYTPSGVKLALMSGSTFQKGFIPLTGGSMAVYSSTGLAYYRHSDWIGSSRFASTPSRTMYSVGAYAPFGEPYAQTGTADASFTGMNQDTASNLYDFPAREYGTQGRWPSPDPAGMSSVDIRNPQTWNRYAYANNNPLLVTDPTGMYGDATAVNALMDGGLFGPSVGAWGQTDLDSWAQEVGWEKADLAAAQAKAAQQPTGTSQNSQSAAQSSSQTTQDSSSGNSASQNGPDPNSTSCVQASNDSSAQLCVVGQQSVPVPGEDSIGVQLTYQLTVNGQPEGTAADAPPGDSVNFTENVVNSEVVDGIYFPQGSNINTGPATLNNQGQFTDTITLTNNQPTTQGRAQSMTIYGPLGPMTGQAYQFTVGYFIQATGPNQGIISMSNGVQVHQ